MIDTTTWAKQFHQIGFVHFIVVPLRNAGVSVNIRKNARNLRTCLVCCAFIAVFRKSTLDKKQSALLFIESNELINLKETIKRAIGTAGFSSVSLGYYDGLMVRKL